MEEGKLNAEDPQSPTDNYESPEYPAIDRLGLVLAGEPSSV